MVPKPSKQSLETQGQNGEHWRVRRRDRMLQKFGVRCCQRNCMDGWICNAVSSAPPLLCGCSLVWALRKQAHICRHGTTFSGTVTHAFWPIGWMALVCLWLPHRGDLRAGGLEMDCGPNERFAQLPPERFLLSMLLRQNWRWRTKDLAKLLWPRSWYSSGSSFFGGWAPEFFAAVGLARDVCGKGDARHCAFPVLGNRKNNQWCFRCTNLSKFSCFPPIKIFFCRQPDVSDPKLAPFRGSALIHMCEAGYFGAMAVAGKYPDRLAPVLRRAHRDFLLFKKMHRLSCSQPRFTPARLNRKQQTCPWPEFLNIFAFCHMCTSSLQTKRVFPIDQKGCFV